MAKWRINTMENNKSVIETPESINAIIKAIKGLNRTELNYLKALVLEKDKNERHKYSFLILNELIKLNTPPTNHFLQNSMALTALVDNEVDLIIHYENWYINLVELAEHGETNNALYPATNKPKFVVIHRNKLLSVIVSRYGLNSKKILGFDFASDEWINILLSKNKLSEIIVMFLIPSFNRREFIDFVEEEISHEKAKRGLTNESFIGVRHILQKIVKFGLHSELIKQKFDIKNIVTIAHGLNDENRDVYWVELGDHFVIANDTKPNGVEIGKLSDFDIDALSKNTLNDYLTQEHFKEFKLIELFKH